MVRELQAGHNPRDRMAYERELEIIVPIIGIKALGLGLEQMFGGCFAAPPIFRGDHFFDARSSGSLDMNKYASISMADHRGEALLLKTRYAIGNRTRHS